MVLSTTIALREQYTSLAYITVAPTIGTVPSFFKYLIIFEICSLFMIYASTQEDITKRLEVGKRLGR